MRTSNQEHAVNRFRSRIAACAVAVVVTAGLMMPSAAFADVAIDGQTLNQGDNAVGNGTATLSESVLDMVNVVAETLTTNEDLTMNFNGGNEINDVYVKDSATVEMNFAGENEVEEVHASGTSDVTVNADGHNEFEEIEATDKSNLTINVAGENKFEEIKGKDDANITIRGLTCQMKDTIILGEGEKDAEISTQRGDLTIDHVTVNIEGKTAKVESAKGNLLIDTSKISKDGDNEYIYITAGGAMNIRESVIDIVGSIRSVGQMVIDHSDVKAAKPDSKYDNSPYRVVSRTGIDPIREKNGEVKKGKLGESDVWYVDTDDNDGEDVDLKADGKPAYYRCGSTKGMPQTGDPMNPLLPMSLVASAAAVAFVMRLREAR